MNILRIVGRGAERLHQLAQQLDENPLLVLHYLENEAKSQLSEVYPMVNIERARVAMVTFRDNEEAETFRRFLSQGVDLDIDTWMTKWVRPLYFEGKWRNETNFWVIFSYVAVGTKLLARNIAYMTDKEIKLWEEEAGKAMRHDFGVTVIKG